LELKRAILDVPLAESQQFALDEVSVETAKHGLGTAPATPDSSSQCCNQKNSDEEKNQHQGNQIEFLHVIDSPKQVKLHVPKGQQKQLVAIDLNEGNTCRHKGNHRKHPVSYPVVG